MSARIWIAQDVFAPHIQHFLESLGLDVSIALCTDSTFLKEDVPTAYLKRVSIERAQQLRQKAVQSPQDLFLGITTAPVVGRRLLQPSTSHKEAVRQLTLLSGRRHRLICAYTLQRSEKKAYGLIQTRVAMKKLTSQEVETLAQQPFFPCDFTASHITAIIGMPGLLQGIPAASLINALKGIGTLA